MMPDSVPSFRGRSIAEAEATAEAGMRAGAAAVPVGHPGGGREARHTPAGAPGAVHVHHAAAGAAGRKHRGFEHVLGRDPGQTGMASTDCGCGCGASEQPQEEAPLWEELECSHGRCDYVDDQNGGQNDDQTRRCHCRSRRPDDNPQRGHQPALALFERPVPIAHAPGSTR